MIATSRLRNASCGLLPEDSGVKASPLVGSSADPEDRPYMLQPPVDLSRPTLADAPAHPKVVAKATILCVDDEPDMLAILAWFLSREGFIVISAENGPEALLRVKQQLPDFLITDHTMPGMTGLELCKRLRAHPDTRHIPIILYTALSLPAHSELYDRLFLKPTDLDILAREIRTMLAPVV